MWRIDRIKEFLLVEILLLLIWKSMLVLLLVVAESWLAVVVGSLWEIQGKCVGFNISKLIVEQLFMAKELCLKVLEGHGNTLCHEWEGRYEGIVAWSQSSYYVITPMSKSIN
jgi:hypothetical protein